MADTDYKAILEQAKDDLLQTQNQLGQLLAEQEMLEKKINGLRATIAALARMLDEDFVEEDAMGLTDAIREAFRSLGTATGMNLTPTEVKGRLEMMGYDTAKYGNVMASVHTIINRLVVKGEIKPVGARADNKPAYQATPRLIEVMQAGKKKPAIPPPPSLDNLKATLMPDGDKK